MVLSTLWGTRQPPPKIYQVQTVACAVVDALSWWDGTLRWQGRPRPTSAAGSAPQSTEAAGKPGVTVPSPLPLGRTVWLSHGYGGRYVQHL